MSNLQVHLNAIVVICNKIQISIKFNSFLNGIIKKTFTGMILCIYPVMCIRYGIFLFWFNELKQPAWYAARGGYISLLSSVDNRTIIMVYIIRNKLIPCR